LKDLNLLCFILYLMSKYESKFRKDMNRLLYIWTELDKIEKQYEEVIMSLRQSAVIPDHLRYHLISGSLK